jgi:hydroxymethylpyrimidine/phosphomethylpyrimidine kinase
VTRAAEAPHVLVAAGFEPTGRVGILADVAAVQAQGGVASAIVTARTAQGEKFALSKVHPRQLLTQLEAALSSRPPDAVKLGMVPDVRSLAILWPRLGDLQVPVVVDPVVRTSLGQRLSTLRPRHYLALAGPGVWLTPNLEEAAWLLGEARPPSTPEEVTQLAVALFSSGFAGVVVKGGHLDGAPMDVLVTAAGVQRFTGTRLARGPSHRGTGCRFASTLATRLALGEEAGRAVQGARGAVRAYLGG